MPRFTIKAMLLATMLVSVWCGAWYYMADVLLHNGPHRDTFYPFVGCFLLACVMSSAMLRPLVVKRFGVNFATVICAVIFNALVFFIVASQVLLR